MAGKVADGFGLADVWQVSMSNRMARNDEYTKDRLSQELQSTSI